MATVPFAAEAATAYSWAMPATASHYLSSMHAATRRPTSPLAPDAAAIDRFLGYCHRRRYPPRTEVFRPGDPAGTLYYVVSGSVSIITEEDDGRELVLGYFGVGEFVGEMGLFIESDRREVILRTRM